MPWHRLRRPHVLKIRGRVEEHYQPATANRMLAALSGVLRECWHAQLLTTDDYQSATSIPAMCGESEQRGRDLSAGEVRGLFEACARGPGEGRREDSAARRRRDAAVLALAYGCGLRRSEMVAIDVADLDLVSGELRGWPAAGRGPAPARRADRPARGGGAAALTRSEPGRSSTSRGRVPYASVKLHFRRLSVVGQGRWPSFCRRPTTIPEAIPSSIAKRRPGRTVGGLDRTAPKMAACQKPVRLRRRWSTSCGSCSVASVP
jgi:hypothetical protein